MLGALELVEGAVVGEGVVLVLGVGTGGPPDDGWRGSGVARVSRGRSVMTDVSPLFLL